MFLKMSHSLTAQKAYTMPVDEPTWSSSSNYAYFLFGSDIERHAVQDVRKINTVAKSKVNEADLTGLRPTIGNTERLGYQSALLWQILQPNTLYVNTLFTLVESHIGESSRCHWTLSALWSLYTKIIKQLIQRESKKSPPAVFWHFPQWLGIFNQFLHTYYTFLSTLDYKFSFNYL